MHTRRSGFTLIELLIVVVIIGVLASIAIPKFSTTKGKANMSAMKSDLHNFAVAQEAYMYDYSEYASDVSKLKFSFSPGVTLVGTVTATKSGWSVVVTHSQAAPKTCALFVGDAAAVAPATRDGVVACDN
jgi:prepilin-type N-terminal cleavage/methylation domain-containing protein